jgi:hypothetical protein
MSRSFGAGTRRIGTAHRSPIAIGHDPARPEGEIMFQKISLMWAGLSKMDILLITMSCVTAGALYAAFVM